MKTTIALILLTLSASSFASEYECFGTEPFWGAKITKTELSIDDFETQSTSKIMSRETAAGVGEDYAFIVRTKDQTASVIAGECNDGMSDNIYSHHIMIDNVGGRVVYGCCNKAE